MINVQKDVDQFLLNELGQYGDTYKDIYNKISKEIETLSQLEEVMLQKRCMTEDNLNNIKLSVLRDYVYARCPFYRKDKTTKDIRVIVSRIDIIYPDDRNPSLDKLYDDHNFINKAKTKLMEAMESEFNEKEFTFWGEYVV